MPLIHLHIPPLDRQAKFELVDALTSSLLRRRGVADTAGARRHVWTFVHEHEDVDAVDGTQLPTMERRCLVRVSALAGSFDGPARAGLVEDLTRAIECAFAHLLAPLRVWVVLDDVPDGRWGDDGALVALADAERLLGDTGSAAA